MFGRLIILVSVGAAVLWFLHWFRRTPPQQVTKTLRRSALYAAIGVLLLLAATGRMNPIFAAIGAAIPIVIRALNLLRMLPAIQQVLRTLGISSVAGAAGAAGPAGTTGQRSTIRTRFLEMTLEHATGQMDGLVLEGLYQGSRLSQLDVEQLLELLTRYRGVDEQSAVVLEAYLDRTHGDAWREEGQGGDKGPTDTGGTMSTEEALAVLGLQPGAGAEEIRDAHRRLMQKLHPDRGGSDYLASKINEAKRLLLGG